jgi:DNA-binding NarL/FixJ family response regulator
MTSSKRIAATVEEYMGKIVSQGETSNERRILIVDDDDDITSFLCAIEARRAGAFGYVLKPFKADELLMTVARAMEVHQLIA